MLKIILNVLQIKKDWFYKLNFLGEFMKDINKEIYNYERLLLPLKSRARRIESRLIQLNNKISEYNDKLNAFKNNSQENVTIKKKTKKLLESHKRSLKRQLLIKEKNDFSIYILMIKINELKLIKKMKDNEVEEKHLRHDMV